jgi:hypothetical protein
MQSNAQDEPELQPQAQTPRTGGEDPPPPAPDFDIEAGGGPLDNGGQVQTTPPP